MHSKSLEQVIIPQNFTSYLSGVLIAAFAIRILISLITFIEVYERIDKGFGGKIKFFFKILSGFWTVREESYSKNQPNHNIPLHRQGDYFLNALIGFFELLAYPILFVSNFHSFIGGWLVLKIAHRMNYNKYTARGPYNRYLLGNIFIFIASAILVYSFFQQEKTVSLLHTMSP